MQLRNINHTALHHLWLSTMTFSLAEVKLYISMIRLNYRVKIAQHPLKMWQYISRCLPQLVPMSWRKELLELLPAASRCPTSALLLVKAVVTQGIQGGCVNVPLHKVNLVSDLVTGSVVVGTRPTLPIKGVSL